MSAVQEKQASNVVRWNMCFAPDDFAAMEYLKQAYMFGSLTNSLRFSLREQVMRDIAHGAGDNGNQKIYSAVRESTTGLLQRVKTYGRDDVRLKQWCCWFSKHDFANLNAIKVHWQFNHFAEALRFALRVQASLEGFVPDGGQW